MDFNQGVPFWQQNDIRIQSPWAPISPTKPTPVRRTVVPSNGQSSHAPSSATSWFDLLTGSYGGGFSQDCLFRQDLNTSDALAYSGRDRGPQISSDNLGLGMAVFGGPSGGWPQTPRTNLAAIASKVPFFTPLMLSQMDGGRMLAPVFDGLAIGSIPNLNSLSERTISMGARYVMPYPWTPVSLEKNKLVQDCLPREVIGPTDDSPTDENKWEETEKSHAQLCVSEPVFPGTAVPFEVLSQQQQTEMRAVVSSEEGTNQALNAETQGKLENNGIDLNKTPRQTPKRKKHRPKVIREGKPARTPRPTTPKPVNPSGKRKYVRRNKAPASSENPLSELAASSSTGTKPVRRSVKNKEDNPSGKRKYVRRRKVEKSSDNPPSMPGGTADPDCNTGSVRRCLNFDLEASKAIDVCSESMPMFTNTAEFQDQEACLAGKTINKDVQPSVHCTPALEVDNSVPGIPIVLDRSTHQLPNDDIRPMEISISHHQPCRSRTVRTDQILDECRPMPEDPTTPPQPSKRESLKKPDRKKFLRISSNPDRSHEPNIIQLDSHETPNLLVKRAKSDHILNHDAQNLTSTNFMHAYATVERLGVFHDASHHDPYLSQGYKKQRTENENGFTSNAASSSMSMPSNTWRRYQMALDTSKAFTSADAQKLMGLKKQLASEGMMAFDQTENNTGKRSELPVKQHPAASVGSVVDFSHMTKPGNQSGQDNQQATDHELSAPLQPFSGNDNQQSQNHESLACMETQVVSTKSGIKTKRGRKKNAQPINHLLNANQVDLQGQNAASCSLVYCLCQKIKEANASTSRDFSEDVSNTSSIINLNSGAIVPYRDPMDDIIQKLRHLTVNEFCMANTTKVQNAVVPYGDGMMVPYGSLFDLTKKRRPRPKVDLDPETNRVWNLLMGKEGGVVGEGTEIEKEKWWEEERQVFRGRVDSFIARMHLVQGDRRFSRWKGSVVDSVVGVFLTQNVSDHLSSSAFMALAARFPLKSRCNYSEPSGEERDSCIKHEDGCIVALNGTNKWQENISHERLDDPSSLVILGDNGTTNSNESFGCNPSGTVADYSKVSCPNSKETVIGVSHDSPDTELGTPIILTGSTSVAEAGDRWSVEDAGSSQNSVSSQNPSENPVQAADQFGIGSLSNFRVEDSTFRSVRDGIDNATSFIELLNSVLDVSGNLRDINSSMSTAITYSQDGNHVKSSLPAAFPLPYHFNNSSSSGLVIMECFNAPSDDATSFTGLLNSLDVSGNLRDTNSSMSTSITYSQDQNYFKSSLPTTLPPPCHFNNSSSSGLVEMESVNAPSDESIFYQDLSSSLSKNTNKFEKMESSIENLTGNISEVISQRNLAASPGSLPEVDMYASTCKHVTQPLASPEAESCFSKQCCCPSNFQININEAPLSELNSQNCSILPDCTVKFQQDKKRLFEVESTEQAVQFELQTQNFDNQQNFQNMHNNRNPLDFSERVQLDLKDDAYISKKDSSETPKRKSKEKKVKDETERKKTHDWDSLRKEVHKHGNEKERSHDTMDSVDWEAVRCAEVNEISQTIRERGMNNMLAERIKEFLNRLVRDHGSVDLEWLREIEPDKAKDYLLSFRGLGLKSVECVRLLTLHHLAFPVDTNVGRICVRLGWVPLQPLPESLQLHLLELYPILETIQKYLWPRLCKLDQRTLYELHYQMITFGKVFCTKSKPNCNACPMRGECKHFASAFASARLALPGPAEKSLVSSTVPIASEENHIPLLNTTNIPQIEGVSNLQARAVFGNCEPIIEEPATPEPECIQIEESAIEDAFYEDPEEIPTIKLNIEEFTQNLQNYMLANNMELQDVDMSKALVAINPEAASIPLPKLKNMSRLRTEHHVYELPDSHPLLEGLDPREPDDPSSYLLAIWTPGETAQSTEPPKASCNLQETGAFCNMATCFSCNSRREAQAQIVRGTILIPCRTAMKGSFPLNGTYFQVNEVFADHDTSRNPIDVPREWIWNLPRRTVYFGTSVPSIFKGLTTEEIQLCFWRGFVCVRGFDRKTRAPRPLYARLHFPASKAPRNKQQAKSSPEKSTANKN